MTQSRGFQGNLRYTITTEHVTNEKSLKDDDRVHTVCLCLHMIQ